MSLNFRIDGDVVVLSNFARLMNDPRYVDAGRDLRDLLDQGRKNFILDLSGLRQPGASFLGVLMSLTRLIQQQHGEVALAHLSPEVAEFLSEMRLEEYWDVFPSVPEAREFFHRGSS
jgi:anti-sigma B factor antagonist